jgi:hypothetical protein
LSANGEANVLINTQFMDDLEIATLKDNILNYLQKHSETAIDLDVIKKDLKLHTMPRGIVNACVAEMEMEKVITFFPIESGDGILLTNDKGQKFLAEGGYIKPIQNKINELRQQEVDKQKARELIDLNIKNLKRAKWFSIAAIIISIAALAVSILKK